MQLCLQGISEVSNYIMSIPHAAITIFVPMITFLWTEYPHFCKQSMSRCSSHEGNFFSCLVNTEFIYMFVVCILFFNCILIMLRVVSSVCILCIFIIIPDDTI